MKKLAFLLIPLFALFFTSNSFALQHNYDALMTVEEMFIPPLVRDSNNLFYRDFSSTDWNDGVGYSYATSYLDMSFPSSFNASFYPYSNQASYYLTTDFDQMSYTDGKCNIVTYASYPARYNVRSTWIRSSGTSLGTPFNHVTISGRGFFVGGGYQPVSYLHDNVTGDTFKCYTSHHAPYDYVSDSPLDNAFTVTSYDGSSRNTGFNPLPDNRVSSYNGVSLSQTGSHSSSGISYTTSFSFSRLFNGPDNYIPYVRSLSIPLQSSDGYFQKYYNLTQGREFNWHFSFRFRNSFELPSDTSTLSAKVVLYGLPRSSQRSDNYVETSYNCVQNVIISEVEGVTHYNVDYSCPVTLDTDYSDFMSVRFVLNNSNDDFYFHTSDKWDFYSAYLVTDNDYTDGGSFNNDLDGDIWGINNGEPTGESDISWFDSFINLFNFNVPSSPIGFLFSSFVNPDTCAQIPIIAGMIYSNETEVCPWFSSNTRSITTPVLTLFSAFLLFGFIMHWLGSASGNFIEDSSDVHTFTVGNHIGSVRSKKK